MRVVYPLQGNLALKLMNTLSKVLVILKIVTVANYIINLKCMEIKAKIMVKVRTIIARFRFEIKVKK